MVSIVKEEFNPAGYRAKLTDITASRYTVCLSLERG